EVSELAGALSGADVVAVDESDAGRVIAAVLEPGQALHHHIEGGAVDVGPDVADDPAHGGERSRVLETPGPGRARSGPSPWSRLRQNERRDAVRGRRPGRSARRPPGGRA